MAFRRHSRDSVNIFSVAYRTRTSCGIARAGVATIAVTRVLISTETPPGNAWSATDNEQFAQWWDGSQYWVYSHSDVDCSQWRGSPGVTVSITWCGVGSGNGSHGNPSNAIWMDAGENLTVTTCSFIGTGCGNQGHGQCTRFYADREYSISSW